MYVAILLTILTITIGLSATAITLHDADAASSNSCNHQTSDNSKKCSQNDTPFVLPFP
jgi:hypothetical protein